MTEETYQRAVGGQESVPPEWMAATDIRSLCEGDASQLWLKYHGKAHGLEQDDLEGTLNKFIMQKGNEFEDCWVRHMMPDAVRVCDEAWEVRQADKVRKTWELMQAQTPVIAQAALWWAPERIYGTPDLLVHTSWLKQYAQELKAAGYDGPALASADTPEHYVVFDIKFKTKLDTSDKKKDWAYCSGQVRLYSYMLGHLQQCMPSHAYVVARDRAKDPYPAPVRSTLGDLLDTDLAALRDQVLDIKLDGAAYYPWRDPRTFINDFEDAMWKTAKEEIAEKKIDGRAREILHRVGRQVRENLTPLGYQNLDSLLAQNPETIPLTSIKGIGPPIASQMRAVLHANRNIKPHPPTIADKPPKKDKEFFVDYEFFTNINVRFDEAWPHMTGCEMIFMIGVGWECAEGKWHCEQFIAETECHDCEKTIIEQFCDFLKDQGASKDPNHTALYHWTHAEATQSKDATKRHQFDADHPFTNLPWNDLQRAFLQVPVGIPGAWKYGLKELSKALGAYMPEYKAKWGDGLDNGADAAVLGWRYYADSTPQRSEYLKKLNPYLEGDCHATYQLLRWLRDQ